MAEIGQAATDVYAPTKTLQVWRTLLNWLTFFFQIFLQIIRGTPSVASLINYSSSSSFMPLPVVEFPESSEPTALATASVHIPSVVADYDCLEKLTVVLDLDETLVCAYETSSLPETVRKQATEAGLAWFELECISSDKEIEGKPKVNYVTVFERPGLHEFLAQLSKFADLVLFTAGLEGYAKPLVDIIDAENRFSRRLYRPSTTSTEYREHVKDLSFVSTDFCRVVIVDNNPFSFLLQPANGIPCIPFSAGQPRDDQLLEVLLPLLKQLSEQRDVRQILYERFHMPEWFEKHGIPASAWATKG
ncbi:CTD nuclear envelope phosphatase 1-like [Cynara cardunculus var. scolymus]|uniref:Dullard phosphatase domain, eukaryotic n=1 Tax=Cynara cardunculus var. scolymus TaxID=59895 RepID=A0A103YIW5_CYNCS|nr:CTD nuclear envelope phosphatase 1-like [Cynara cardunculus var. scolymus]KVI09950.1 Dullard phosphatase domain, eukaryotic [Cynara cardunculus var. scolymus]